MERGDLAEGDGDEPLDADDWGRSQNMSDFERSEFEYNVRLAKKYRSRILSQEPHGFALGQIDGHWLVYIGQTDNAFNRVEHLKKMHFKEAPEQIKMLPSITKANQNGSSIHLTSITHGQMKLKDGGLQLIDCDPPGTTTTVTRVNKALRLLKLRKFRPYRETSRPPESEPLEDEADGAFDDLRPEEPDAP